MVDIETIGDAFFISVVVVFVIVVVVAAIVYAFIKKKKNYDSTGIPKRVEKPEEHEGSTDRTIEKQAGSTDDKHIEGRTDAE